MKEKHINKEKEAENAVPEDHDITSNAPKDDNVAPKNDAPDPLEAALCEVEELKKQLLYKAAEFENFRKRTIAEKTDLILNGGQNVIKTILPVLDDMERATQNATKNDDIHALEEGWELIAKKLYKALEGLGVTKIVTDNADFNTDYHEAIAQIPTDDVNKKGKVIDCVLTGYMINDKVLRHAKVAVGV